MREEVGEPFKDASRLWVFALGLMRGGGQGDVWKGGRRRSREAEGHARADGKG